ncbi:hypothetical protein [Rhizobium sp. BK376]|uniref:hypothetical protein n=1 Tax=Rhizobium sp. BK376 TaxID=2512149 RepID=UPI00104B4802|nr:hypothetical protein [Rhizobium sp. BK376]
MASIRNLFGDEEGVIAAEPSPRERRLQMERILANPTLQASARRRLLLRYVVEETLDGRADFLKGYPIARAVFGRDETFDAQSDPVVRLEARRLRRDLDCYYAGEGSRDMIRISIPRGGYIPHFEWMDASARSRPLNLAEPNDVATGPLEKESQTTVTLSAPVEIREADGRKWRPGRATAMFAVLLICAAAAGAWIWNDMGARSSNAVAGGPAIIVLPFDALSLSDNDRFLATGLTQQLISNLIQFDTMRLYSLPPGFVQDSVTDIGRHLAVAYVVRGSLRSQGDTVRLNTQLVDAHSGQVVWSETYDRPFATTTLIDVQKELADRVARALSQSVGVMTANPDDRPVAKAADGPGS